MSQPISVQDITVHYVHNRTRTANTPKITVKHINFYKLKAIEALFGKNEASPELQGDETAEWLTGEQVDQMLNSTVVARRTFVSRHKIPNKKEYGITYYLRSAIEDAMNPLAKYGDKYFTVEQIMERFDLPRDKVYGIMRYSDVRREHVGSYTLFLKEDVIRVMYDRMNK